MPPKVKFEKDSIIEAAFIVVRYNGWQGISARAIAKELNSSTGPIYSQLKSMRNLEEVLVKKAMEFFQEYIIAPRTGDKWLDHGLGYLLFAKNEKHLFKAIHDENHIMLKKKHSFKLWEKLEEELADYHLFKDLPEDIVLEIRRSRWIYTHGVASLIANSYEFDEIRSDEDLIKLIQGASMALYRGIKSSSL
jgi:AcrR family transcriptional regulator